MISAKIEDNEKSVELYLSRNYKNEKNTEQVSEDYFHEENDKPEPVKVRSKENSDTDSKGIKLLKELFLGESDEEE